MPDWWENRYFLDANDPSDANQDLDGDGRTNLDEYLDGTDPTKPDGFPVKESKPLPKILLSIGIFLMLLSTGFLIYSRKVLVPQQRKAAAASRQAAQQAGQSKPGLKLAGKPGIGIDSGGLAERIAQRQAARKSALKGFEEEKAGVGDGADVKSGAESSIESKKKADAAKKPSDEFIPLSKLGKIAGKSKEAQAGAEKPKSGIFEKLREFTATYGRGAKDKKKQPDVKLEKQPEKPSEKQPEKPQPAKQAEQQGAQQEKKQGSQGSQGSEPDKQSEKKEQDDKEEPKQVKG
jgi:hypothetical protein